MTLGDGKTLGEDKPPRATGRCLCGAVRYQIRGPLRAVVNCHCGQCRRTHGNVAAYTSAARADLVLTEDHGLKWYRSSEVAQRGFCRDCGASLFWEPLGGTGSRSRPAASTRRAGSRPSGTSSLPTRATITRSPTDSKLFPPDTAVNTKECRRTKNLTGG